MNTNPNFYLHLAIAAFFAFILIIVLKIWRASREDCRLSRMKDEAERKRWAGIEDYEADEIHDK